MVDYKRIKLFLKKVHVRKRKKLVYLLILSIVGAVSEVISITAIIPFLSSLSNPELIFNLPVIGIKIQNLNFSNTDLFFYTTVFFIVTTLIAYSIRLTLLWYARKISFDLGSDIAIDAFKNTLKKTYGDFTRMDSSELINVLSVKVDRIITTFILPTLEFITSSLLMVGIVIFLLFYALYFSLLLFFVVLIVYLLMAKLADKKLKKNSRHISIGAKKIVQDSQDGFYGFRDIIYSNSINYFVKKYAVNDRRYRASQANNFFLNQSPRYIIESVSIVTIAIAAYVFQKNSDGVFDIITVVGVVVLSLNRLLPLAQRIYATWSIKRGDSDSFSDVFELLNAPKNSKEFDGDSLKFDSEIELKKVSYRQDNKADFIFQGISLKVQKKSIVGIVGESGSGKSTLANIISGLVLPSQGSVFVDNSKITTKNVNNWMRSVYYLPQKIYMFNTTIKKNIATGLASKDIDEERVKLCCEIARISHDIEGLKYGYDSLIGDNGSKFSGGQAQRMVIARALYFNPDLLILDESLSGVSLDVEDKILDNIINHYKDITLIIISHRPKVLRRCTHIIDVGNYTNKT